MTDVATQSTERLQRIEFRAMGSQILALVESDAPEARTLLAEVPRWFEEWEQTLSRFRDSSELSALNRSAGSDSPAQVSETLWRVLELALGAARATGGLVTPTVLNAVEAAGYTVTFDDIPGASDGSQAGRAGGPAAQPLPAPWRDIELHPETRSVRLPAGVRLDLGGIAKGWAADEAANRLGERGPALVNAGGDIAVSGPMSDGAWPVGIDAPLLPAFAPDTQLELLAVTSGGVATSGSDYRRWQQGGEWRHHIIDPRTGQPSTSDVVSATIVGPSASVAEVGAKTALLLGGMQGIEWLDSRPSLAGLLVLGDGQVLRSRRLSDYLWSTHYAE